MLAVVIAIVVVVLILIVGLVVVAMSGSSAPAPSTMPSGSMQPAPASGGAAPAPVSVPTSAGRQYIYFQGKDSPLNDITQRADLADNVSGLKAACDSTPGCVGFNTNGWIKNKIIPQAQWVSWTTDPNKGSYFLQGAY